MIGSLRGTVVDRTSGGEILLDVAGVGYRVYVPVPALTQLEPRAAAHLFTHLHVRDDAMILYGFLARDDRDTFETLIGVTGIGPKLALAMLAVHPPNALRRVLADDDLAALCLVPGVGKRTAQRLLIELKAKLDLPDVDLTGGDDGAGSARSEVRAALIAMGFGPDEIRDVVGALAPDGTVETLLRDALKQLAGRA